MRLTSAGITARTEAPARPPLEVGYRHYKLNQCILLSLLFTWMVLVSVECKPHSLCLLSTKIKTETEFILTHLTVLLLGETVLLAVHIFSG